MSNNLIPEQRPDKNGNVVTRWVRGMFQPKDTGRTIPQVTIDDSPHPMPKREAKAIFNRLMATMPEGDTIEILADADRHTLRRLDDMRVLESSFENRQYDLLPLFESFGEKHAFDDVRGATRLIETKDLDAELTDESLTAYTSMRTAMGKAIKKSQEEEGVPLPEMYTGTVDLPRHVLVHPEDAPTLIRIIGQGVSDKEKIMEMLADIKSGNLAPVISEGFL